MLTPFTRAAARGLNRAIADVATRGDRRTDFRAAICRFEDELFAEFPAGHRLIEYSMAVAMIGEIFTACGRAPPQLTLVAGFDDPRVGGYADVEGVIATGAPTPFTILDEALDNAKGFATMALSIQKSFWPSALLARTFGA